MSMLPTRIASSIGGPYSNSAHCTCTPWELRRWSKALCCFAVISMASPFWKPTRSTFAEALTAGLTVAPMATVESAASKALREIT
jgi:hypothetical protein